MEPKTPYEALQHEICVDLGFCGSIVGNKQSHVDFFIPEQGMVNADEFVEWVLLAEGQSLDGQTATKHAASLREAFVRHMGDETVDAACLKWPL